MPVWPINFLVEPVFQSLPRELSKDTSKIRHIFKKIIIFTTP